VAMVRRLVILALLAMAAAASAVHSQGVPESRQLQINSALQDALAWTGLYDGLADGAIGEKSIAAISQFQRRQGWAPTGDLDPSQKIELLRIADTARRQVGFQVVNDRGAMLAIGLPTRLLATRKDTSRGSIYESADKQIEVILARFGREEGGLRAVYERVVNSPSMTGFSYRLIRGDAFFVAGFKSKRDFYHSARVVENEVRGFTIAYPRERAAEIGPIIVAMGNSFKAPIADYAAIAQMITPSPTPAVAGFVQRAQAVDLDRMSCGELWLARNEIFKAAGYCFQTERAIRQFGNAGCRFISVNELALNSSQRETVAAVLKLEAVRSCVGNAPAQAARPQSQQAQPFIERARLITLVSSFMSDAGITAYRFLPPDGTDDIALTWVFEDGRIGEQIALRPGSGMKLDEIANGAMQREAKSCKGTFGSMRPQSRYFQGSEIQKLEAICRAQAGVRATTYSIIELPSGAVLRFTSTGLAASEQPSNDDRGTRIENAALLFASSKVDAFK
jgi:hypothetical protein